LRLVWRFGILTGMARPLRIQFPGAVYHVISRGNERKPIVRDDGVASPGSGLVFGVRSGARKGAAAPGSATVFGIGRGIAPPAG